MHVSVESGGGGRVEGQVVCMRAYVCVCMWGGGERRMSVCKTTHTHTYTHSSFFHEIKKKNTIYIYIYFSFSS